MNQIASRLPAVAGDYRFDVDIAKFCWFQVGGPVDVLFKPKNIEDLQFFLLNKPKDIPIFVFGVGSNLLVSDAGFRGVAIRLGREFNFVEHDDGVVFAGAAALDVNVAQYAAQNSIAGLEFLSGIPGTIGGAIAMNAGAYGMEIKDVLISARAINDVGELREFKNDEFGFHYRGKELPNSWTFIDAKLQGIEGDAAEIADKISHIQKSREESQPIRSRTGGSTFQNPKGHKAWQLIDDAGCRGLVIGDAQVSEMHCNFFINRGNAKASDLISLIQTVKERVYNKSGILLQEEIKIIG